MQVQKGSTLSDHLPVMSSSLICGTGPSPNRWGAVPVAAFEVGAGYDEGRGCEAVGAKRGGGFDASGSWMSTSRPTQMDRVSRNLACAHRWRGEGESRRGGNA